MHFKTPHFRQGIGHKVRVGVAITLFTGAFLLTSGIFTRAYSQERKSKGGDTVLLMQTDSTFKAPVAQKDTPKAAAPWQVTLKDALTLTHYVPHSLRDYSSPEVRMRALDSKIKRVYAEGWARMEDATVPFDLPRDVYENCKPQQRAIIDANWKAALREIHVYFMSDKEGLSITLKSSNVNDLHTPKEIEQLLGYWDFLKSSTGKNFWNPPVR